MKTKNTLLKLTDREQRKLKILFLAKLAPISKYASEPTLDDVEGVVPVYHHNLFHDLEKLGLDITPNRKAAHLLSDHEKYNYVFSILNRAKYRNSEILVSSLCEYLSLPYLGAQPHTRSLAEDKHLTKILARSLGIKTANWTHYRVDTPVSFQPEFQGPYFIKPRFGAASEYISDNSIQYDWPATKTQIEVLLDQKVDVIVEEFIDGDNVTVPIVNGPKPIVLPCVEDISNAPGGILTYRKNRLLESGMSRAIFEEPFPTRTMQEAAIVLLPHLSPIDYFRVDFRVQKDTRYPYLLEVNICCNLGKHSNVAIPALHHGIEYLSLLEHIIAFSIRRQHFVGN